MRASLWPLVAVLGASCLVGACGGSTTKTKPKPHTRKVTVPTKARPVTVAIRALTRGASEQPAPAESARATAGQPVQAVVRVYPSSAGQPLTIRLRKVGKAWTVRATVASGGAAQGTIRLAADLGLSRLSYACHLAPLTFCPVRVAREGPGRMTFHLQARTTPVALGLAFDHPGKVPRPTLVKLGPRGAAAKLLAQAQELPASGKPPAPGTSAAVSPGSRVRVLVRPVAGTGGRPVRISLMRSGADYTVRAGSRGGPATTASIKGKGPIRVTDPTWSCRLPPGTFCPLHTAARTGTGFRFSLPSPRVPVQLIFSVERG